MLKNLFKKLVGKNDSKEGSSVPVLEKEIVPIPTVQASTPKVEQPKLEVFEFNVAGVTAKNEDKKDIQKLLRQQGKLYLKENYLDLFGGYKNREIIEDDLEVAEFEDLLFAQQEISFVPEPTNEYDSNAIKVYIKYDEVPIHIGYVPKKDNDELKRILGEEDVRRYEARYVGGKIKSVDYDEEEDKDIVVIEELTLGVEIEVFYKK
jgi:hypothetical protein